MGQPILPKREILLMGTQVAREIPQRIAQKSAKEEEFVIKI
jgi:hypothetical protein